MEEVKEVKLYGTWASAYCVMVQIALKIKGVPYEYVEEDLQNKSEVLLSLNPVHKKVPVLVVDGKPIAESLVILEYIEEKWKKGSPLLPEDDPYKRAMVRFWADFFYQKMIPCSYAIMRTAGEAQEKATEEFIEHLNTVENGIKKDFPKSEGPFINGDSPGFLDLIIGSSGSGFRVLTEIAGKELLEKERMPVLYTCLSSFANLPVAEDVLAPYEKLLPRILALREKALAAAQS
ncbi:glutathione S-transferase U10-like [Typha latifolia]|uniref:glutathione S-transferase U10-like n=1 Tax=Typha latifolia TaxID=4733 RepID=UPI003C2DFB4C